jgi:hypothetical protein
MHASMSSANDTQPTAATGGAALLARLRAAKAVPVSAADGPLQVASKQASAQVPLTQGSHDQQNGAATKSASTESPAAQPSAPPLTGGAAILARLRYAALPPHTPLIVELV